MIRSPKVPCSLLAGRTLGPNSDRSSLASFQRWPTVDVAPFAAPVEACKTVDDAVVAAVRHQGAFAAAFRPSIEVRQITHVGAEIDDRRQALRKRAGPAAHELPAIRIGRARFRIFQCSLKERARRRRRVDARGGAFTARRAGAPAARCLARRAAVRVVARFAKHARSAARDAGEQRKKRRFDERHRHVHQAPQEYRISTLRWNGARKAPRNSRSTGRLHPHSLTPRAPRYFS
jgi:hypothetical protein